MTRLLAKLRRLFRKPEADEHEIQQHDLYVTEMLWGNKSFRFGEFE